MGPWLEGLLLGGDWYAAIAHDEKKSCWGHKAEDAWKLGTSLSTLWGQGSLHSGDTGAQLLA